MGKECIDLSCVNVYVCVCVCEIRPIKMQRSPLSPLPKTEWMEDDVARPPSHRFLTPPLPALGPWAELRGPEHGAWHSAG